MVLYGSCEGTFGALTETGGMIETNFVDLTMSPNPYTAGGDVTFTGKLIRVDNGAGIPQTGYAALYKDAVLITPIDTDAAGQFVDTIPGVAGNYTIEFMGGEI